MIGQQFYPRVGMELPDSSIYAHLDLATGTRLSSQICIIRRHLRWVSEAIAHSGAPYISSLLAGLIVDLGETNG